MSEEATDSEAVEVPEENLEERLGSEAPKERRSISDREEELSEEDREAMDALVEEARSLISRSSGQEREYAEKNLSKLVAYSKAVKKHNKSQRRPASFRRWMESAYSLIGGFLDTGEGKQDIRKEIDSTKSNTVVFLLPGLLDYPYTGKHLREYSGLDVVRVGTRDPAEIKGIIDYAHNQGLKTVVFGFSDGEKRIGKTIDLYGGENIDLVIGAASNKNIPYNGISPDKVIYINGRNDLLAPIESGYFNDSLSKTLYVPGGHVAMVRKQDTIEQVGKIIRSHIPVRARHLDVKPWSRAA